MHYSEIAGLCEVLPKTVHTYLADWTNPTYADPGFGGIRRDEDGYLLYCHFVAQDDGADDDLGPPPPGWVSIEELGQLIMGDLLSRSTARALIQLLAESGDSPDALRVAFLAVLFQVQDQVDDASKDLINYVLGSVPPVKAMFADTSGSYPITEDLSLKRYLDSDNRFALGASVQWLEPLALEIQERLDRWAASTNEDTSDENEPN